MERGFSFSRTGLHGFETRPACVSRTSLWLSPGVTVQGLETPTAEMVTLQPPTDQNPASRPGVK